MKKQITISDFIKLTGSTLKTIIYYHKISLLPEPKRSPGGYRLYGAWELTRMQLIKHLKSLGLEEKDRPRCSHDEKRKQPISYEGSLQREVVKPQGYAGVPSSWSA